MDDHCPLVVWTCDVTERYVLVFITVALLRFSVVGDFTLAATAVAA